MNSRALLLANVAIAFYLVGAIWALEVDIFRSWRLVSAGDFHNVQRVHWRKLPYWVFLPLALALSGSTGLIFRHPAASPAWAIWGTLGTQLCSHLLTAVHWGPLQHKLSRDERGPASPYLQKFVVTHWLRALLISAYGGILLAWAILVLA